MNNQLKLLSLFSGIGAFEKALTNINKDFELVGFSEIDKYAIEAYSEIFSVNKNLNLGDISLINNSDIPYSDLVTYGFPCQDISAAGLVKGINEGSRSGLLFQAERIIEYAKPKYAIAENVKNLVGKKFKGDFEMLLKRLDGYGYNNYWQILKAKDFRIPQNRDRIFIVSIRKDIDKGNFIFPTGSDSGLRLKDFLLNENEIEEKYYVDNERVDTFISKLDREKIGINMNELNRLGGLFDEAGKRRQAGSVWDKEGLAPTIDTCQGGYRQPCILESNDRVRKLSPQECWRLMGFSDEDYLSAREVLKKEFYNGKDRSNSQMYKMAGNSIVVPVLEAILTNLLKEG